MGWRKILDIFREVFWVGIKNISARNTVIWHHNQYANFKQNSSSTRENEINEMVKRAGAM